MDQATRYHINAKGEVGICHAWIQCPFGGEDRHYATADEARTAYEASMRGQDLESFSKSREHDRQEALERENSRKPITTKVPIFDAQEVRIEAEGVFEANNARPVALRVQNPTYGDYNQGDELPEGEIVSRGKVRSNGQIQFTLLGGAKIMRNANKAPANLGPAGELPLTPEVRQELRLWRFDREKFVREHIKEARKAQEALELEAQVEDYALNELPHSRSLLDKTRHLFEGDHVPGYLNEEDAARALSRAIKFYHRKVADFRKNGSPLPYSSAMETMKTVKSKNVGLKLLYNGEFSDVDPWAESGELIALMLEKKTQRDDPRQGEGWYTEIHPSFTTFQKEALRQLDPHHPYLSNFS